MSCYPSQPNPILRLSYNRHYSFVACDSLAKAYLSCLVKTMQLKETGSEGKSILVYVSDADSGCPDILEPSSDHGPLLCSLTQAEDSTMFALQVEKIARIVATDVIKKGGALVHGGLCSINGLGAVLAGSGNIGKTTASKRLPYPWVSHSDDATLVIPDDSGGYNAHPWPTWSKFYFGGSGGTWAVEKSIPLVKLFFLRQSEKVFLEPLEKYQSTTMLFDTIEQLTRLNLRFLTHKEKQIILSKYMRSAKSIVEVIPAYRLHISLEGNFWEEMEKVMSAPERVHKASSFAHTYPDKSFPVKLHSIYRGASMNPTFIDPELLTVLPYNNRKPKKGDIICYKLEPEEFGTVHRIVAVKGNIIKTKGDNANLVDDYQIDQSKIIGRVIASKRNNKKKIIYGGQAGIIDMYLQRLKRNINLAAAKFFYKSYRYLSQTGFCKKLKPHKMVFEVVVFERYSIKYPKLILNNRTVGNYDFRRNNWKIKRPYRLFINVNNLPSYEGQTDYSDN